MTDLVTDLVLKEAFKTDAAFLTELVRDYPTVALKVFKKLTGHGLDLVSALSQLPKDEEILIWHPKQKSPIAFQVSTLDMPSEPGVFGYINFSVSLCEPGAKNGRNFIGFLLVRSYLQGGTVVFEDEAVS